MKTLNLTAISLLAVCLLGSTILRANPINDAKLPLSGGGVATFQQPISVNLDAIPLSTEGNYYKYDVHCTLTNNTSDPIYVNFGSKGKFASQSISSYTLGGKYIQGDSSAILNPSSSEYVANLVVVLAKGASLIFNDLDTTSAYTVSNCYAIPHMDS